MKMKKNLMFEVSFGRHKEREIPSETLEKIKEMENKIASLYHPIAYVKNAIEKFNVAFEKTDDSGIIDQLQKKLDSMEKEASDARDKLANYIKSLWENDYLDIISVGRVLSESEKHLF